MSTNYNLAENCESGIPLCNSNHPGNVSRCTAWKAASLKVALTHHDLEPCEGDFAIWQPGLAPWPGFQPRGSQRPVLRQCGLWIVLWVPGCLWGNSPNERYGSPGGLVSRVTMCSWAGCTPHRKINPWGNSEGCCFVCFYEMVSLMQPQA